ncbi:MAG: 30S ribosomal protein S9 [bacterium]
MANKEYYYAIGRRKETTAIVKLFSKGTGNFSVTSPNGQTRSLKEYFGGNLYLFDNALAPLFTLGSEFPKQFDAEITINGGGIAGQSDAIRLGFARALTLHDADFRLTLKPYGLLKRDPRVKERKKPGLKKSRKAPTWSKR